MIYKKFAMVFVNKFCSLLYITFWLQVTKLRTALIIMLMNDLVIVTVCR
jgi:hypothetical protein